jgi:1-deoxy-D-xylulose-5-phosphate reductoisomerase
MKALAALRRQPATPSLAEVLARKVTVLGSTGSIGVNTLDVIAHARSVYGPEAYPVAALTAGGNVNRLIEQAKAVKPKLAVIGDERLYPNLKSALAGTGIEVAAGRSAIIEAACRPVGVVMVAIMGAAAIAPALAAVERGTMLALANKECVVAAGHVFQKMQEISGADIVPVDSEHNAVFQVFQGSADDGVEKVILTASGGPFRDWDIERMRTVTPEQAVAHPNWSMGAKISVDSATLMNKGLELIEAHYLFALPSDKLDVVVHPQSVVHALVAHIDGSTLAHLSPPDMRTPIAHALAWPRRIHSPSRKLNLAEIGELTFRKPDTIRFPALPLAIEAMRIGGVATTVLNAANEVAVSAFLERKIGFLDITRVVEKTLKESRDVGFPAETLEEVLAIDAKARERASGICRRMMV